MREREAIHPTMYNSDFPNRADLPSSGRLLRSTFLAFGVSIVLLVTVVLPSEYAIDPTGAGRMLGLTQMGEIKEQLAAEAGADTHGTTAEVLQRSQDAERLDAIERQLDQIRKALVALRAQEAISPARQPAAEDTVEAPPAPIVPAGWRDEIQITLQPGQGVEFKLVMAANARAAFEWTANGSVLNFDTHGDGGGQSISYEKGRAVPGQSGVLTAAFDGNHGWFWRNRTDQPVTLTLRTRGDYVELKRTV